MKLREKTVSRIASVLLAAVMAVSMVPAAFAATTAKCSHIINQAAVDNGDGTCSYICIKCQAVMDTTAHVYEDHDGKTTCVRCGAEKPVTVCDHVNQQAVDNHDGTCSYVCKDCHTVLDTQAHVYYDGETKCARCGAEKPVENVITFTRVDDTHHRVHTVLADGTKYDVTVACNFDNGTCVCGNVKGNVKPACDHMGQHFKFVPNNNGTHNVLCDDCKAVVSENVPCNYVDGKCTQCGAEKPACDHMGNHWTYVNNGNSTHNVVCADCGAVVSANVACNYENGVCITCSAKQSECNHMGNHWTYEDNGNGTHKVICKDCGNIVEKHADCVYTDGKCAACGHKKAVFIPDTDDLDPSFSVSRYPICQFFQAVREFFRSLFHRA